MRETSFATLASSREQLSVAAKASVQNSAVANRNYWDSHDGLAQIGERYLSRAKIRREKDGLVFVVPTSFHLKVIQPWKDAIEAALGESIVAFEIGREEKKLGQDALSVEKSLALREETQRKYDKEGSSYNSAQLSIQLTPQNPENDRIEKEKSRRMIAPQLICSPSLEVPIQLLNRWAQQSQKGHEVLWVYGGPGSGKTTLMRQLNHLIPLSRKLEFTDTISFLHEWRQALDQNNAFAFIKKYRRDTDILVIENIEELRGKKQTQQELLFTMNALSDRGASFAVSSSVAPQDLKEDLDPQLYSRLLSGLVVEIQVPDKIFKENLWRSLMAQHGLSSFQVDLVVLEKIFNLPLATARKVQTVFINAIARLSVSGKLSLQDVYEFEGIHAPQTVPMTSTGMNPRQLIEKVSKICGTSSAAVLGKSRKADVVLTRKFVFLALSRILGMTNTSIAHYVEKDPSTVCHALKTVCEALAKDRHISKQWNWICSEMGMKDYFTGIS